VRYHGPRGEQVSGYHQVHGHDYEVNDRCDETSRTCLNIVEQPLACGVNEPARYVYARDAAGQIVSTKHYGANGKPAGDPSYSVFELRDQWDEQGNHVGRSCYWSDGQAVPCARTGFHAVKWTFDEAGRKTEERFFDTSGSATTNLGCSVRRFQYDNYDHLYESRNYGATGQPIEVLGMSIRRELYDAGHRKFAVLLLDKAGKPARYSGCFVGVHCPTGKWHAVRIVRTANGSVQKNLYFDADGQLVQTVACGKVRCWS
jgi:hypothetical protein